LTSLLLAQEGVTEEVLEERLTIIQGDARHKETVKRILTCTASSQQRVREKGDDGVRVPDGSGDLVDMIISGIGGSPKLQWSLRQPITLDNPTVCQDAASTLVEALGELQHEGRFSHGTRKKPLLAFVSTTGISNGPEDVPFGLRWLYHYVLTMPHKDKNVMEAIFREHGTGEKQRVFGDVIGVRPSLLTGTGDVRNVKGVESVRVGGEKEPAVGYWIKRADVGRWIFREVIERDGKGWGGEMVTLTY
jgi:hypothetical protein